VPGDNNSTSTTNANQPSPECQDDDEEDDCILFNGIFYLGCASVSSPRNKEETLKTISILRSQHVSTGSQQANDTANSSHGEENSTVIEVVLSVPSRADGLVR